MSRASHSGLPYEWDNPSGVMSQRVTLLMKMSRAEAEELAEQVADRLRPQIVQAVADILCGPDDVGISPLDRKRIEQAARNMQRKMMGLPTDRRRKLG